MVSFFASLWVGTDTVLLTCDDPSKVGTSVEVEVSYRVLGAYASSGIAAGCRSTARIFSA
jgi:hypothetical protein